MTIPTVSTPKTANRPMPTQKGKWPWSNIVNFIKDPIGFHNKVIQEKGDSFYFKVPIGKAIITANPEFIKYVLQTNHKNYEKDKSYDDLALLLGKGLVTSRGDFWRKQRKIAQPAFYKKNLEKLYLDMIAVAENYMEGLKQSSDQVVEINREMMAVTAKIAMKSLFSEDFNDKVKDIYECISVSQEYTIKKSMNPLFVPMGYINGAHRNFKKQRAVMDELIYGLITQRRNNPGEHHDLLQMLLDARYEDTGDPMSEEQLRDELVTIFSAGHETSSNGLTWTLYLLSQNPEVLAKLRAEVDEVLGNDSPSFEQLRQLVYTRQVLEEGMRVYPPVWGVGRYAKEDDEWQGNPIPKNSVIFSQIYHLHHHKDLWEEPEKFDPDRFTPDRVKARPKHHYLPFGSGPRMCIGNHFAMMEMQLLLPLLVREFDFELLPNQKIVLNPRITLGPKYGINMRLKSRAK